eukprot:scaffold9801_cov17-Tisochrysis_lutea.AAC.2
MPNASVKVLPSQNYCASKSMSAKGLTGLHCVGLSLHGGKCCRSEGHKGHNGFLKHWNRVPQLHMQVHRPHTHTSNVSPMHLIQRTTSTEMTLLTHANKGSIQVRTLAAHPEPLNMQTVCTP